MDEPRDEIQQGIVDAVSDVATGGIDQDDARAASHMSREKASRFYDRIREQIIGYFEKKGGVAARSKDVLLFAPDVFILLWRLANDSRVTAKNKVLLGTGIAYYVFPLDIFPEALLGPIGLVDDLILGVYILNRMLTDTDEEILREHWSGSGDVLAMIRRVLNSADQLVASDVLKKIKKVVR